MHAAAVGAQHLHAQAVDGDDFVALGQAPEVVDDQSADGVEMLVGKFRGERRVEIGDFGQPWSLYCGMKAVSV